MRRSILALGVAVALGLGAYGVSAVEKCTMSCGSSERASAQSSCSPAKGAATTACENPHSKIAGNFDPVMSGVCRFACATKLKYDSKDVQAQPGAKAGRLTQCPVSGVVFAVDPSRPRVRIGKDDYIVCCDKCAQKLKASPSHYLKA